MTMKRRLDDQTLPIDGLNQISGIGPARRRWLNDTFHITCAADLAAASADEIYKRMKEEQIISLSKIESWIEQAKAMTNSEITKPILKSEEQGWKPFATFVVEFQEDSVTGQLQTKAHHVEADKTFKWPGIEQTTLVKWLTDQLGTKAQSVIASPADANLMEFVQPKFNERLETILERVSRLAPEQQWLSNQKQLLGAAPTSNAEENITVTTTIVSSKSQPMGYSEKLKQILARTQKATAKVG